MSTGLELPKRMVVRSGVLVVSVVSPADAAADVERLVTEAGGFVEDSIETRDSSATLYCRVPAPQLDAIMRAIGGLGKERRRSLSAADVTDQYADLETRLRNGLALRDRLRQLLGRAVKVEDVLAIEKELNRLQSEVETLQARFDRLQSQVELSALSVTLERRRILGPLGYVLYGVWWTVSKLFVLD